MSSGNRKTNDSTTRKETKNTTAADVETLNQIYKAKVEDLSPLKFQPANKPEDLATSNKPANVIVLCDEKSAKRKLTEALGTSDVDLQMFLFNRTYNTFERAGSVCATNKEVGEFCNITAAILQEIKPQGVIESMLSTQMIAVYNAAMRSMRNVMTSVHPQVVDTNIEQSTKLMRTFTAQMQALKQFRTGGQQKMTVEHVHVHSGGQAIVGQVNSDGGGVNEEK
jgi:hypothetical protein